MKNLERQARINHIRGCSQFNVEMFVLLPQAAAIKEKAKHIGVKQKHGCRILEKYGERVFQAR